MRCLRGALRLCGLLGLRGFLGLRRFFRLCGFLGFRGFLSLRVSLGFRSPVGLSLRIHFGLGGALCLRGVVRGAPFEGKFLRFGNLLGRYAPGHLIAVRGRLRDALVGCEAPPHVSLNMVRRYAPVLHVEEPEIILGDGIALLGGPPEPEERLAKILGHAPALII
jgi:hypothetical protein